MKIKRLLKLKRKIVRKILIIGALCAVFFLLSFLKNNATFAEKYTRTAVFFYQKTLGKIIAFLPFSLMEILFILLFILVIIWIRKILKNRIIKKPGSTLNILLNFPLTFCLILTVHQATAEVQYNREEMPVNYYENEVAKEDLLPIISYFVEDMNSLAKSFEYDEDGEIVLPYSFSELADLCSKEYERTSDYDYLCSYTTKCKPMLNSFIYRELHITGYTFNPTTEANINTLNVVGSIPYTMLHELAHSKGIMREDDAQQMAMIMALTSSNPYIRFSGYYCTLYSILNLTYLTGNEEDIQTISSLICNEYKAYRSFGSCYWDNHDLLSDFGEWWNNLYLKVSGVEEGTESYTDKPAEETPTKIYYSKYQKIYFQIYFGGNLL